MRASAETIYVWIYAPEQKAHARWGYLPRGRQKRRKRGGRRTHSDRINYRVSISERPPEVDDRKEFGHWEADSVLGLRGTGDVHTEVERTSRMLMARKVTGSPAEEASRAQKEIFLQFTSARRYVNNCR